MDNPWTALPDEQPYVLETDRPSVDRHNRKVESKYRLRLDVLPEPFLGRPDAPVVLLNLNPGFDGTEPGWLKVPRYRSALWNSLRHQEHRWPLVFLDPELADCGGGKWWRPRTRTLRETTSDEAVAHNVVVLEHFPYHSSKYRRVVGGVSSQGYTFYLLRRAMERDALVIIMRSRKEWQASVPGLATYPLAFALNSPQSVYLTPNNMPVDAWHLLVEQVTRG